MDAHRAYLVTEGSEEDMGSPGTGVTDSCELSRGRLELNPGPLQGQQGFLATEQNLHSDLTPFSEFFCFVLFLVF